MPYLPVAKIAIPPRPMFMVLEDRADGTQWVLSHDSTGNYIAINDQGLVKGGDLIGNWPDVRFYGPYEGPIVPNPLANQEYSAATKCRLLIRGGYLGYEEIDPSESYGVPAQARILTRRGLSITIREILVPSVWNKFNSAKSTDILGWIELD